MSVYSGSNVIKAGLVFYYDMSNSQSWKGAPTTNLLNPDNNAVNTYHPSYRPYSSIGHGTIVTTTEVTPPFPGYTVYKVSDDGVDTQNVRYSIRMNASTFLEYDKTYVLSYYVYLPSKYAGRYINSNMDVFQNTTGSDWHSTRGYNATYNFYGAGYIRVASSSPVMTKLDQWQRIWVSFNPLSANVNLPENNGLDNNIWVAGYIRVNMSGAVNGGTPYHLYISTAQLEETIVTPFTADTRSSTTSLLDLLNNNTATLSNLVYSSNYTASFNGINSHISLGAASNIISENQNSITVNAWVKPTSVGSYRKILTTMTEGTTTITGLYLSLGNLASNGAYFGVKADSTGSDFAGYNSFISTTDYTNLCGTYDGTTIRLYVNGVLVSSKAYTGNLGRGGIARVSGYDNNNETWSGEIPTISVYNRALSADEVKQNFNATKSRFGL